MKNDVDHVLDSDEFLTNRDALTERPIIIDIMRQVLTKLSELSETFMKLPMLEVSKRHRYPVSITFSINTDAYHVHAESPFWNDTYVYTAWKKFLDTPQENLTMFREALSMVFTGVCSRMERTIQGIDLTQMSGKLSPDLIDDEQTVALLSRYSDQLRPLHFRLAASAPSIINDFRCEIYRQNEEVIIFLLLPILPLGTKPVPIYEMTPMLTNTSSGYVLEWRPSGMLIHAPQGEAYQTVTEQQMQQWCCVVGDDLFCHPDMLTTQVHSSCTQELLRGLTTNETALACYDSFVLRDPGSVYVLKCDDNRFYVYSPSSRQIPVRCHGQMMPIIITIFPGVNEMFMPSPCRATIEGWPIHPTLPKFPPNGFTWIIPMSRFDNLISTLHVPWISDLSEHLLGKVNNLMHQERGLTLKAWSDLVQQSNTHAQIVRVLGQDSSWLPILGSICGFLGCLMLLFCIAIYRMYRRRRSLRSDFDDVQSSPEVLIQVGRNVGESSIDTEL